MLLFMLSQITTDNKRRLALTALVWLLSRMHPRVTRQRIASGKRAIALVALVAFFAGMAALVCAQLSLVDKRQIALVAFVRLFASMSAQMIDKTTTLPKTRLAVRTLERFLARMHADMDGECALRNERLRTAITAEGFFAGVHTHMMSQTAPMPEPRLTQAALERLLPGVNPLVNGEGVFRDAAHVTLIATKRSIGRMLASMNHKLAFINEPGAAFRTLIRLLGVVHTFHVVGEIATLVKARITVGTREGALGEVQLTVQTERTLRSER